MILLGIYLFSLALGGVLIGASVFLGDHNDADADADADADVGDHDGDLGDHDTEATASGGHGMDAWLPFFSLRFWTFALASFGLTGSLLYLVGIRSVFTLAISLPMGFAIGFAVASLFRYLKKDAVGSLTSSRDLQGTDGRVLLAVGPSKTGKIRIRVAGQDVDLPAITREATLLEPDSRVLVVTVREGTAEVVAVSPEATLPN